VVTELRVEQFLSEIKLVISDQIALHLVQLPINENVAKDKNALFGTM